MPTKPRTLAGILRSRRHADQEYNRARRDPVVARIHGSARWQAVRARVLRDEPVCRECARVGLTEAATQVDHVVPLAVAPELAFVRSNLCPTCTACHARKSQAERARLKGGVGGSKDSQASAATSGARGTPFFSRDRTPNLPRYCTGFQHPQTPTEPGNQASEADEASAERPARKCPEVEGSPGGPAEGRREP